MTTKHEVLAYFRLHPEATSIQIAEALDCGDAYVRTTLTRTGLRLKDARRGSKFPSSFASDRPTLIAKERDRCARLAERMGAKLVADAIRAGVKP